MVYRAIPVPSQAASPKTTRLPAAIMLIPKVWPMQISSFRGRERKLDLGLPDKENTSCNSQKAAIGALEIARTVPAHAGGIRPSRLAMILSTIRLGRTDVMRYRIGSGVIW